MAYLNNNANSTVLELENEIKGYKAISDGYIKTCAKLTEEILSLKTQIARFVPSNSKISK